MCIPIEKLYVLFFLVFLNQTGCIVKEHCFDHSDCDPDQVCSNSQCIRGCRQSSDCPDGQDCISFQCVSDSFDADVQDCEVTCPEDMVPICGYCIDIYEASRPDATEGSPGSDDSIATSRPLVRPWVNMTRETAEAACSAAGKRLCTRQEWTRACRGTSDTEYPYGDAYEPTTCNGIDAYGRGNQRMMPTGSFADCTNGYGVFDISGNVWEIDQDLPGFVHGGAYNCIDSASLHRCSYNQNFGTDPRTNVGFRCCSDGE